MCWPISSQFRSDFDEGKMRIYALLLVLAALSCLAETSVPEKDQTREAKLSNSSDATRAKKGKIETKQLVSSSTSRRSSRRRVVSSSSSSSSNSSSSSSSSSSSDSSSGGHSSSSSSGHSGQIEQYLSIKVCGNVFYCKQTSQGPCPRNQMLVAGNGSTHDSVFPCSGLANYPWEGCLSTRHAGVLSDSDKSIIKHGRCAVRFAWNPCYGYPPSYRFHAQSQRCYPLLHRHYSWPGMRMSTPCLADQQFTDVDGVNGECRCRRPDYLLWTANQTCYRTLTQGPCQEGEWFEHLDNGIGICHESPCPRGRIDGYHIFWDARIQGKSGCYRTNTRGPCARGQIFKIDDYLSQRGRCVSQNREPYYPGQNRPYPHEFPPQFVPYTPYGRRPQFQTFQEYDDVASETGLGYEEMDPFEYMMDLEESESDPFANPLDDADDSLDVFDSAGQTLE